MQVLLLQALSKPTMVMCTAVKCIAFEPEMWRLRDAQLLYRKHEKRIVPLLHVLGESASPKHLTQPGVVTQIESHPMSVTVYASHMFGTWLDRKVDSVLSASTFSIHHLI